MECSSQGLQVHPLPEGLPQLGPGGGDGAVAGPGQAEVARRLVALVAGVQQRQRRLTLRLDVEDAQGGVLAAGGAAAADVVALQLLDDGGELGVQGRAARLGARGPRGPRAVLLLLVGEGPLLVGGGRGRWPGRAGRRGGAVGLSVGGRGRGAALLAAAAADGCGAGRGGRAARAARARTRCGGLGLGGGGGARLHRPLARPVEQRRPVGQTLVLLAADEEAAVRLLDPVVDQVCDALELAR